MHRVGNRPAGWRLRPGGVSWREAASRTSTRCAAGIVLSAGLLIAGGQGSAGHSVGHFPSYYPDEIRIEATDPAAAAKGLIEQTLHAYVGASPDFAGPVPEHVQAIRSLGSFLVLSFDVDSARFASAEARCAAAAGILTALREEEAQGFVFHPYPVTPYHADYLHHLDLAEAATSAVGGTPEPQSMTMGAKGRVAEKIVRARWQLATGGADVVLEEVPVEHLLAPAGMRLDGWSGRPWAKEGWYQAHRLLAPGLHGATRQAVEDDHGLLLNGQTLGLAEHADIERRLVAALIDDCARLVVGYTVRQEYVGVGYPAGIENIGFDSQSGLNSPVFFRTVKLKEYPWNGKVHLAVREPSDDAWNPVAGFTGTMGRMIWSAVGDPAMIQFPFNASWMPNRVQAAVTRVEGQSGGIRVPDDAIRPQPGTGALQPVGARTFASAKVVYDVLASPFDDGSEMEPPDLLYPLMFAYRWGAKPGAGDAYDPRLEASLAAIEERLAGFKLVRVDETEHAVAEGLEIVRKTPVLEVYLRDVPADDPQIAATAPPWSTVPWHLLALMEEAVLRGFAAFSEEEAERRQVPWLDLVRDQALRAKLQDLIAQFEREGYRPRPLEDLVSADDARRRWRSLGAFADKNGHLLVTNGPYGLQEWSADSVVLKAVRELSYPLGFGTFDRFVNPPRAVIESVTKEPGEITVRASAEIILRAGRGTRLVKEPLLRTTTRDTFGLLVVSRYLLIGPDGTVLDVDKMQWMDDGRFAIKLSDRLPPGEYTVALAIFLDGNAMLPSAETLRFRIGEAGAPG